MTRYPYTMPGVLALLFAAMLALVAITHMPPDFVAPGQTVGHPIRNFDDIQAAGR